MTNDIPIILCAAIAALTVYDLLKAARTAGGWARSGLFAGWAASAAMLGLHSRWAGDDLPEDEGEGDRPPRPRILPGAPSARRTGVSSALVYLIGVLSPLFGLGLAVHPLI